MKLILLPLTEVMNLSNAIETEEKLVLHYQYSGSSKNPLTELLSRHLEDWGWNLGIPWSSFKGALEFWQEPEEMACSYANFSHDQDSWEYFGVGKEVYAIHKASLMRKLSHNSLLNTASGAPLWVTAFRDRKSSRKVQSHQGLCRSKSTPLLQSGKAAGEQQRSQSTGVILCHAEELSAKIQLQDC